MTSEFADAPGPARHVAPVLRTRNISRRFGGVQALDGVSIELWPGEVHCLAGENGCGKSTLIKVISGAETPDAGTIEIDGVSHSRMRTTSAILSGIQVIYQDFSLFSNLSVAENIVLTSAVAENRKLYRRSEARAHAGRIVEELQLNLDLDAEVGAISVADRQLTAICRALSSDARVIIMDEPTTALTHTEVDRLFEVVSRLRERGVALMFVSHKLNEVLAISQRVTIMRSGRVVTTGPAEEFDTRSITRHMTGNDVVDAREVTQVDHSRPPRLEVAGLSLAGAFRDVSFAVQPGEILGITGLLGSGRAELVEAIFGVHPADSGSVLIDGSPVRIQSIPDAIAAGIGYVPEDRLTQGLFLSKPIEDNIMASSLDAERTRWGTLNFASMAERVASLVSRLRVKAPDTRAAVRTLSGGNAQRVVLAKWLATDPKVLMLNGPTVGVDVGSKAQILELLRAEARAGKAVVIISDDAPELVACCNRVLIVSRGRLVDALDGDEITVEAIHEGMAA